jgi:hypothetical protein
MSQPADDWGCDAYGPDGRQAGALCFLSPELHQRRCGSHAECTATVAASRQQLFGRLSELAAAGDPVWEAVAEQIPRPDRIWPDDGQGER